VIALGELAEYRITHYEAGGTDAPDLGNRMKLLSWLFTRVTYTCTFCEAVQTIPVRRIAIFFLMVMENPRRDTSC
jgi:hypothetical protein